MIVGNFFGGVVAKCLAIYVNSLPLYGTSPFMQLLVLGNNVQYAVILAKYVSVEDDSKRLKMITLVFFMTRPESPY